jgi:hypothetical protein
VDGVVADVVSLVKVEVAVEATGTDPVFRTVHPKFLKPRDEPGPGDDALRRLIHRAAAPGHSAAGDASEHAAPARPATCCSAARAASCRSWW